MRISPDLKELSIAPETTLDLDRFNFVRGPMCVERSSIHMALEYCSRDDVK